MVENLRELLEDKDWKVETVSKKLGVTKENRDDTKILQYAEIIFGNAENSKFLIASPTKKIHEL